MASSIKCHVGEKEREREKEGYQFGLPPMIKNAFIRDKEFR
jgi:hypothetical protein